jgi:hypothetical protein
VFAQAFCQCRFVLQPTDSSMNKAAFAALVLLSAARLVPRPIPALTLARAVHNQFAFATCPYSDKLNCCIVSFHKLHVRRRLFDPAAMAPCLSGDWDFFQLLCLKNRTSLLGKVWRRFLIAHLLDDAVNDPPLGLRQAGRHPSTVETDGKLMMPALSFSFIITSRDNGSKKNVY